MKISDILNQSVGGYSLGNILTAAITLLVCLTIVRYAIKIINRLLEVTNLDFRVRRLISNGLKMIMYVITAIIVAQGLGVNMTSFVALLSVVSLGVAMASEDLLGNFAGGLVILTSHPFAIGDLVESSGNLGTVAEIDLAHTKILNPDGQYILIPNRDLAASRIINYSALGRRRVTVKVTASYDAPTDDVFAACNDALAMTENILSNPEPAVYLTNYGASSIEYTIFCWTPPANYWGVMFALNKNLRDTFEKHNVEMTYDHLNVHVVDIAAPSAQAKDRPVLEKNP